MSESILGSAIPNIDTCTAKQVAEALGTSEAGLAQMRYRGTGPKFCRVGLRRIIYRWSDVSDYLDLNTVSRSSDK